MLARSQGDSKRFLRLNTHLPHDYIQSPQLISGFPHIFSDENCLTPKQLEELNPFMLRTAMEDNLSLIFHACLIRHLKNIFGAIFL